VRELNDILTRMKAALDIDKNRTNELSQLRKNNEAHFWWTCPFDRMNMVQLGSFKKALEDLQKLVAHYADRVEIQGTSTQPLPFLVGNGSSSNISFEHQPNPHQDSIFLAQLLQNLIFLYEPLDPP